MHPEESKLNGENAKLISLKKKSIYQVLEALVTEFTFDIRNKYTHQNKGLYRKIIRWAQLSVAAAIITLVLFSGIRVFVHKQYLPLETDRGIYTLQDGNLNKE